ncbi:MAG: hypothetical protein ABJC19_01520 [Gemmatimonadota bacterium]
MTPFHRGIILLGLGLSFSQPSAAQRPSAFIGYGRFVYDAGGDQAYPLLTAGMSLQTSSLTRAVLQFDYSDIGTAYPSETLPSPGHERYYRAFAILEASLVGAAPVATPRKAVDLAVRVGAGVAHSANRGLILPSPWSHPGPKNIPSGGTSTRAYEETFPRWGSAFLGGVTASVRITGSLALRGSADASFDRVLGTTLRNWAFSTGLQLR